MLGSRGYSSFVGRSCEVLGVMTFCIDRPPMWYPHIRSGVMVWSICILLDLKPKFEACEGRMFMERRLVYRDYLGITEKEMEATIGF